ncbi:uncharacterized protein N7496_001954 [Penicillium cataractarum]|uniref:Uncharacterized protein n=1 Tax=Penicillium cataractarum TaxID=2100454 RepID=A0A9W9VWY0_9EURO|nr:uncharacterized protein N7496_001954 [Penicillium cataractarum]KAJ5390886.1 hypothetical protein N7496_001954 [Penicillium cataractarum]
MTLTEGTAVKRYERLLSSYGLDMSYQQKKDAHNSPKQSSSVAGPNTTAVAEKTLKQNHINSSERDGTKNPGDEVWSTVSLEKKLCPEAYTTWWLYIPESREMAFVAFLLDGSRSTALRVRLSES